MQHHNSCFLTAATALALFPVSAAAAPPAVSAELCVPQATGVPGPQPKTPQWWDAAAPGKEQRWTGSTRIEETQTVTGGTPMSWVRAVWDTPSRSLFVRFAVRSDPTLDPALDHVVMALTDASGQPALYIQLDPILGCAGAPDSDGDGVKDECEGEGRAIPVGPGGGVKFAAPVSPLSADDWTSVSTTNPAPTFTVDHAWVSMNGRSDASGPLYDWDVQLVVQIPVDAGTGQAGAAARVFATTMVQLGSPISGANAQFPAACIPSPIDPSSCALSGTTDDARADSIPASITDRWAPLRTSERCGGVSLDVALVGSDHNEVAGTLDGAAYVYPGNEIPKTTGARMRAGIRNELGRALASGEISAEFRIAGWGATYAQWDQATWMSIGTATLSGSLADHGVANAPGGSTVAMAAPWMPGSGFTYDHQCVHVQLTGQGGTDLLFANDSVYKNMNLVSASSFRRTAEINLVGLEPVDAQRRVMLLVDTRGMPSHDQCWRMSDNDDVPRFVPLPGCWTPNTKEVLPPVLGIPNKQDGVDSPDELPTYAVHAFVDTRKTVGPDGTPVYIPFSGYGYHVQHRGQVNGWEHALHGAQHPPQAPHNVYFVDMKPNEIVTVSNTIRALEPDSPACGTAGAGASLPGCDEPKLPPPRPVTSAAEPGEPPIEVSPPPISCCAQSFSTKQSISHSMVFLLTMLGLRRRTRRKKPLEKPA